MIHKFRTINPKIGKPNRIIRQYRMVSTNPVLTQYNASIGSKNAMSELAEGTSEKERKLGILVGNRRLPIKPCKKPL